MRPVLVFARLGRTGSLRWCGMLGLQPWIGDPTRLGLRSIASRCHTPRRARGHSTHSKNDPHDHHGHGHGPGAHHHGHTVDLFLRKPSTEAEKTGARITLYGLYSNVAYTVLKAAAGVWYGSASLIADAAHQASDLVSDFVTLFTFRLARKEADPSHPHGYGRWEPMGALAVSGILLAGAAGTGAYSCEALFHVFQTTSVVHAHSGGPIITGSSHIDQWAIWLMLSSVLVKEALFRATLRVGERYNSSVLIANAWHHRSDSLSSVVALVGVGGSYLGMPFLDPVGGLLVSLMIAKVGWETGVSSVRELVDAQVPGLLKGLDEVVRELKEKEKNLLGLEQVRGRKRGPNVTIDAIMVVRPHISVSHAHQIGEALRFAIFKAFDDVDEINIHIDSSPNPYHYQEGDDHGRIFERPTSDVEAQIRKVLSSTPGVLGTSHVLLIYNAGGDQIHAQAEIVIVDSMTVSEARAIAKQASKQVVETVEGVKTADIHVELTNHKDS
ncbi:cation efflux family-domain-containing protein [Hyaloraphidium curvatum]|nr:cation efflux family-domain-containing protein [Hyaloraphidium curvatum]